MVLVIAGELDSLAQSVAANWPDQPAVLLTPRDLCARGWSLELGRPEEFQIVAQGRVFPCRDFAGILTLLPSVSEYELVTIERSDRNYVAAELTALLFYFLSQVRCPVVNRPTAQCLSGPGWRQEQWMHACRTVGIPTKTAYRKSRLPTAPDEVAGVFSRVSVVGDTCVGDRAVAFQSKIIDLAKLAGVTVLQVRFLEQDGMQVFHSVDLLPDLHDEQLVRAIQEVFTHA